MKGQPPPAFLAPLQLIVCDKTGEGLYFFLEYANIILYI